MCLRRQFIISHICDMNVIYMIRMSRTQEEEEEEEEVWNMSQKTVDIYLMYMHMRDMMYMMIRHRTKVTNRGIAWNVTHGDIQCVSEDSLGSGAGRQMMQMLRANFSFDLRALSSI